MLTENRCACDDLANSERPLSSTGGIVQICYRTLSHRSYALCRFTIGEFEPIVNFCHLKGYHLQSEAPDELMQNQIKSYLLLIQKSFSDVMVS